MDLRSGHPYWLMKDGMPYEYGRLYNDASTEVTVIGGGISGALTAYHLTEAGIPCLLVDAELIGMGSTCASTGLLQYEIDVPLYKLEKKIGIRNAQDAYKLSLNAVKGICNLCRQLGFEAFAERKSLYFAAEARHKKTIEQEFQARKNAGLPVSLLYKNEIINQFYFEAETAILSQDAAEIDAYAFTHAILQKAISNGLKVYARTGVKKIKHHKNYIQLTTHEGCGIKTNYVVHASGYAAALHIDKSLLEIQSTYAICSEQADFKQNTWEGETLIWNTADPYYYQRTTYNNRIMIGGRDEKFYNPAKRDKLIPRKTKLLVKDFQKLFPDIPFKPEFSWAGTFITTPDGLPYIGPYKNNRELYALGYGGNGITFSFIAAEMLSYIVQGKEHEAMKLFAFDR